MPLVIFSSITIMAIIYFICIPKKINALELSVIALVVIYLDSNFVDIILLNLDRFEISEHPIDIVTFYINLIILFPLIIVWSVNFFCRIKALLGKLLIIVFTTSLITAIESVSEQFKIVEFVHWEWWWTFLQWFLTWIISYFIRLWFRRLLLKELER